MCLVHLFLSKAYLLESASLLAVWPSLCLFLAPKMQLWPRAPPALSNAYFQPFAVCANLDLKSVPLGLLSTKFRSFGAVLSNSANFYLLALDTGSLASSYHTQALDSLFEVVTQLFSQCLRHQCRWLAFFRAALGLLFS